mmetsp:Transcript_129987/g.417281  ORF Transcript_129987/g.417281 Transcript_129987/m.417281 type:complete len:615 (-) Transcript_129987:551-2395(-)
MGPEEATPVVVVDVLLRGVVVNEEVVVDVAPLHHHRGFARPDRRQKRLPVPRVERPVVSRLPAGREDEVVSQFVATPEAVIVVDAGTGPVEEHVPHDGALRSLRLHVEAALLLIQADFACRVPQDVVVERMVAIGAVDAGVGEVRAWRVVWEARVFGLVRVPPRHNGIATNEGEVVVLDCRVAVVAGNHQGVAVQAFEHGVLHLHTLSALDEEGAFSVQGPISRGGHAVGIHVGVARGLEGHSIDGQILHRVPLRPRDVHEHAQLWHDHLQIRRRSACAIVEQVQLPGCLVEEELTWVVQLLENILNEEIASAVLAARTLVASPAKGEVIGGGVVVRNLEHPIGPPLWPPHIDDGLAHVLVWRVRQCTLARRHARGCAEGEGTAARGVLRAPIAHRRIVDAAEPVDSDHVVCEPSIGCGVSVVLLGVVGEVLHRAELIEIRWCPGRGPRANHVAVPGRDLNTAWQVRISGPRRANTIELEARDFRDLSLDVRLVNVHRDASFAGDVPTLAHRGPISVQPPPAIVRPLPLASIMPSEGRALTIGLARLLAWRRAWFLPVVADCAVVWRRSGDDIGALEGLKVARWRDLVGTPHGADLLSPAHHGRLSGVGADREA